MSVARYPLYRDSGFEWLGEVPAHWSVQRLRTIATLNPSKGELRGWNRDTDVSFLPMEAIGEDGSLDLSRERPLAELDGGYSYFRNGDVAIAKITPCFENGKGAVLRGLREGVGFGTTELIVVRPDEGCVSAPFLHYLFNSRQFRGLGEAHMYGAGGQQRVPDDFVRNFAAPLPPRAEQDRIVDFLDAETATLDALVAEQQRLIALLKEKRRSLVSYRMVGSSAVQRPLASSQGPTLESTPADWRVTRLKYLVEPAVGIQMGPFGGMLLDLSVLDTGYKVYGQQNTISGDFSLGQRWISASRFAELAGYELCCGDIVLTRKGSLGNARLVRSLPSPGVVDSDTIRVRVLRSLISAEFLELVLHEAWYVQLQIEVARRGAILAGLNSETVANLLIAVPPLEQQEAVLSQVRRETTEIDASLTAAERLVALLQERRTALISAAVTGRIDVRRFRPTEELVLA